MTLPPSGPLTLQQINGEFGLGSNLGAYRGVTWYTDSGSSGTFSASNLGINQFYGKRATSPKYELTVTENTQQMDVWSWAKARGWDGNSQLVITVPAGIYIWSDNIGTAAMTFNAIYPQGVTIINNGFIMGKGGSGTDQRYDAGGHNGEAGGPAISVVAAGVSVQNNSYIGGGGGAGGSAGGVGASGGGAGGGKGGTFIFINGSTPGGAGGSIGQPGGNSPARQYDATYISGGGGGGRIMPGNGGAAGTNVDHTSYGGGAGGGGGTQDGSPWGDEYCPGGNGGSGGNPGADSTKKWIPSEGFYIASGGGGGGWGAKGGDTWEYNNAIDSGGAGGRCIQLNGYQVTTQGGGAYWGAIS